MNYPFPDFVAGDVDAELLAYRSRDARRDNSNVPDIWYFADADGGIFWHDPREMNRFDFEWQTNRSYFGKGERRNATARICRDSSIWMLAGALQKERGSAGWKVFPTTEIVQLSLEEKEVSKEARKPGER